MKKLIIFLDIDGVLNSDTWNKSSAKFKEGLKSDNKFTDCFDPECIARLNMVTNATDAKIVVSSDWRSMDNIEGILEQVGITGDVIDTTPVMRFSYCAVIPIPRGCEIKEYLACNDWDDYIILDDFADMLYEQRNHFFQTQTSVGLTSETASEIVKYFKKIYL